MATPAQFIALTGGGAFDPTVVPNLKADYDFSDPSVLFTDTGLTTPVVNDGDAIAGFRDKSSIAWNATQATGAKKPVYKVNVQNGRSVARITNGTSGLTSVAKSLVAQPVTIVALFKQTSKATAARLIDSSDGGVNRILMGLNTSGFAEMYAGTVIADAIDHSGTFIIESVILNGASSFIYVNGVQTATGNPGAVQFGTINQIGYDATNGITGDMGRILIYGGALSSANHNYVGLGLAGQWGLPWTAVP